MKEVWENVFFMISHFNPSGLRVAVSVDSCYRYQAPCIGLREPDLAREDAPPDPMPKRFDVHIILRSCQFQTEVQWCGIGSGQRRSNTIAILAIVVPVTREEGCLNQGDFILFVVHVKQDLLSRSTSLCMVQGIHLPWLAENVPLEDFNLRARLLLRDRV